MTIQTKWYDAADAELVTSPPLSGNAGEESAPVTLRLYNDKDLAGADTAGVGVLFGHARLTSSGLPLATGVPLVDYRMVAARIKQGLGGKSVPAGAWTPLGRGSFLEIPSLASGEGVEIEFILEAPHGAQGFNAFLVPQYYATTWTPIGPGIPEIQGDGIYLGVGDPLVTALVVGEDVVENPAGADDQVRVGTLVWIAAGVPHAYHQDLVNIAASAAGNSRYVLLSLAADGTLTLTDGVETASPLDEDDKPAVPAGEVAIAYVARDDSAAIQQADISQVYQLGLYAISSSGLTANVGPGRALVDNALTLNHAGQPASLTASETNRLWLQRSGTLAVTTTAAQPAGTRPLLLAELVTDGSGVTELRDRRRFIGHRLHRISFDWLGVVAAGDFRYAINPSDRPAYLLPIGGLRAAVAVGGTVSGSTRFEVEVDADHDDTWTALTEPTAAPEIAFDATDLRSLDAVPAAFLIPPGARIRASADAVPGGADSEDAHLELLVVER